MKSTPIANRMVITIGIMLQVVLLSAQVPEGFSYQAVARDANGVCIASQSISILVNIRDTAANGPILYQEQHFGIPTNSQGLFSISIGVDPTKATGGGQTTDFSSLNWINQARWMEIEMDPAGGGLFVPVGAQQLMSVPYALAAGNGKQFSAENEDEFFNLNGTNGFSNVGIGGRPDVNGGYNLGEIRLRDANGVTKIHNYVSEDASGNGVGIMILDGENGNRNFAVATSGTSNHGSFSVYDPDGNARANIQSEDSWGGAGRIQTLGPNGFRNIDLSIETSLTTVGQNRGLLRIYDENGTQQAWMGVDASGNGYVAADGANGGVKSFTMDHPSQPEKKIWYASIEGPEAAAYDRGTAKLINGEAQITFSEHFEIVANTSTMTVILTPRSPKSKGLAAYEYTETGFKVKELFDGNGSYDFDWEAKAVRKGWEDFEVIRDKEEEPAWESDDEN